VIAKLLDLLLAAYQVAISPYLGAHCRFHPTCSSYAREAIAVHGAVRGTWLAVRRVLRCHPLGAAGVDPVPSKDA